MPEPEQPAPALRAEAVVKRFEGVAALDSVTLDIRAGECLALVGESGAGKTTLLRCFNRGVDPDAGRILIGPDDAAALDPIALRRRVGYVPQDGGLLPHWRVERNVALVPWLRGDPDPPARARAALDLVGLPADRFAARRPRQLSGGQRQRVAVARALAASPGLVLLDEPFGALDALTRAELRATFTELHRRLGFTAVVVTHDLIEALMLGDRVGVMRAGRLEQLATPTELRSRPATPYVEALLAAGLPA